MSALYSLFYYLLQYPIKLFVHYNVIPSKSSNDLADNNNIQQPIFYVVRRRSACDLLILQKACKQQGLPDPLSFITISDEVFPRTFFLEKEISSTIEQGERLLQAHSSIPNLNAQLIPAHIIWGRKPSKEKLNTSIGALLAEQKSPSWLIKSLIVIFFGRNTLVRFSEKMPFRYIADQYGDDKDAAQKLFRIARFHFYRQTISATGPRLLNRKKMFSLLMKNTAIKNVIQDEVKAKNKTIKEINKDALTIMDEIAGDYRFSIVRIGSRLLNWLWNRIYSGIEVKNAHLLRDVAQSGDEIIYVPCHRSHMDYLLLTHVIFTEGLVTPRIAAGINLNFWPAGPIFRKAGAFFLRRSFAGNRLYSTIFREYLALLFERGYSVKYYTEGGRSRTGKLLAPKTGMLAMTIQSLLRGIDRPITLVPVYIGYEHVMEVATYHKELSGGAKKKESIGGVLNAIKHLQNYGKGFVTFGQPININNFLSEQVPGWKMDINEVQIKKPNWLTPSVNALASKVMTHINNAAAINGVALIALILHNTKNKALSGRELEKQLDFFIKIQTLAPYSDQVNIPEESGASLLTHVIDLNKVTVNKDSLGEIISLSPVGILEMQYYRNNILHLYMLPALVSRLILSQNKIKVPILITQINTLITLIKADLFLSYTDNTLNIQISQILNVFLEEQLITISKADIITVTGDLQKSELYLLAQTCNETLQRFAIILSVMKNTDGIDKKSLEHQSIAIAQRLSTLNNINDHEFINNKVQNNIINTIESEGYIQENCSGQYLKSDSFEHLYKIIMPLISNDVQQSIIHDSE